jgi:hypothetical protein
MSTSQNGICERFHKTVLNEFYRVAFRKKVYRSIDELQVDWTCDSASTMNKGRNTQPQERGDLNTHSVASAKPWVPFWLKNTRQSDARGVSSRSIMHATGLASNASFKRSAK